MELQIYICPKEWARISRKIDILLADFNGRYIPRVKDFILALIYDTYPASRNKGKCTRTDMIGKPFQSFNFGDTNASRKIKKLLEQNGILFNDGSHSDGHDHCQRIWTCSYCIIYSPQTPPSEWIRLQFPSEISVIEDLVDKIKSIRKITVPTVFLEEGKINLDKKALCFDIINGNVAPKEAHEFVSLCKRFGTGKAIQKANSKREFRNRLVALETVEAPSRYNGPTAKDHREYTLLSLCPKSFYKYLKSDDGHQLIELCDLHAGFIHSLMFAFSAFYDDFEEEFGTTTFSYLEGEIARDHKDLYDEIATFVDAWERKGERRSNLFIRKTTKEEKERTGKSYTVKTKKEIRDDIKVYVQRTINASKSTMKAYKTKANNYYKRIRTKDTTRISPKAVESEREARWIMLCARFFHERFPTFFKAVMETENKGFQFRLMTYGEKILISAIAKQIKKQIGDIPMYRKHDAIVACVPETMVSMAVSSMNSALLKIGNTGCKNTYEFFKEKYENDKH